MNQEALKRALIRWGARQGIFIPFVLFLVVIAILAPRFLSLDNILQVLRQVSITGVMALGVTFVVICGKLDLSVGSLLSLTTALVVDLHDKIGPGPAIVVALVAGMASGVVSGLLVGYLRLNALIVTLGMLSLLQGITLIYTGGKNVGIAHPESTWFAVIGRGYIAGIPVPVVIFIGLAILLGVVLQRTAFGRRVFAVGGNEVASAFSGIKASRIILAAYVLSGLTTAIAALIMGSRVMGSQNDVGSGYELRVLAGVILGGSSLLGGSGGMFRTVVGVVVLGFIENGLLLIGLPYYVQWLVTWVVIIGAVWTDLASRGQRRFA
jgi:ribose transport system permease protein